VRCLKQGTGLASSTSLRELIFSAFEQLSVLKINFHKSELFCFGEVVDEANSYAELFGCGIGYFPISYLGISIHYRLNGKLLKKDFKNVLLVGKEKITIPW
jgi:hypothetical protein